MMVNSYYMVSFILFGLFKLNAYQGNSSALVDMAVLILVSFAMSIENVWMHRMSMAVVSDGLERHPYV